MFDPIVYSHEIGVAKPNAGAFAELRRLLDLPYDQICFIDDSPANLRTAEALGITGVLHVEGSTAAMVDNLCRLLAL